MVKFLAERGLPLRGHCEVFGQPDNGNHMGVLEVIREFDPFYVNAGKGTPSYLSSTTCLGFIELMGEQVLAEIISQIKKVESTFRSVLIPLLTLSTPTSSHSSFDTWHMMAASQSV